MKKCKTWDTIIPHSPIIADTYIEFYDILGSLTYYHNILLENESNVEHNAYNFTKTATEVNMDIIYLIENFRSKIDSAFIIEKIIIDSSIIDINILLNKENSLNYYNIPLDFTMLETIDIEIFKIQTFEIIKFFQGFNRIKLSIKIFGIILEHFPNANKYNNLWEYLKQIVQRITIPKFINGISFIDEIKMLITRSIDTLEEYKMVIRNKLPKIYYKLIWYWDTFPTIIALF